VKTWKQILVIVGVGCFLTLPLLIYGLSIQSDDGATHVVWYTSFATQFWSGDLYPRWLMDLNNGLGSPAFFYYPPVPYFLTSLLKPLFGGDANGIHQLGISAAMSVILSGIFTWAWCREFVDDVSAMVGGVAFMLTPYHLVIDLYTRSSFAELWSFAWIPLVLLFVHRLAHGKRAAVVGLAISYALLIGTHLPTTLIFSLVPLVYASFIAEKGSRLRSLALVAVAMALGVGLSAIFLYPAMTMQEYVFVDRMSLGHFSYSNWLLLSGFYYEKDVDLRPIWRIFFVFIDLAVLTVGAFVLARRSEQLEAKKIAVCWFAVGIAAAVMMTDVSRPIWDLLSTLQKVQFPFRFGVVLSVAVTALLVLGVSRLRDTSDCIGSKAIVVICAFLWLPFAAWGFSHYATPVAADDVEFKNNVIRDRRDQPEYRPRWSQTMAAIDWNDSTNEDDWSDKLDKEYDSLLDRTGARDASTPRAFITSGSGNAGVVSWEPREIRLRTDVQGPAAVRIIQFYFPGWQARLADSGEKLEVTPTEPDGLISVNVPAGDHVIGVELTATHAESVGKIVSASSAALILLYSIFFAVAKIRKQQLPGLDI
jgi:hypothetical protein